MKDKVFQNDCFELDLAALSINIFLLSKHQDLAHNNLMVFRFAAY